jgi:hypothetical protein
MLLVAPTHTVANLMSKRRLFDVAWHFVKESIISVCQWPAPCVSHQNVVFNIALKIRTQAIEIWECPRTENAPGAPGGALPKAAANFDARALAAWGSSVVGQPCEKNNIEPPHQMSEALFFAWIPQQGPQALASGGQGGTIWSWTYCSGKDHVRKALFLRRNKNRMMIRPGPNLLGPMGLIWRNLPRPAEA